MDLQFSIILLILEPTISIVVPSGKKVKNCQFLSIFAFSGLVIVPKSQALSGNRLTN